MRSLLYSATLILVFALFFDIELTHIKLIFTAIRAIPGSVLILLPIFIIFWLSLRFLKNNQDEKVIVRFAIRIILVAFLSKLIWVLIFDANQTNDFKHYLYCGFEEAAGKPLGEIPCERGSLHWQRAFFYTYPIALIFGNSSLALEIINVILLTIASFFFFMTGKKIFTSKVATIALLFFVLHPELWYATTLASHDIMAIFWLSIFFYVFTLFQNSTQPLPRVLLAVVLGLVIFFMEFARSYSQPAFISMAIYFLYSTFKEKAKTKLVSLILLLVIPISTYKIVNKVFWTSVQIDPTEYQLNTVCYLSSIDVTGVGRFREISRWYSEQCPMIAIEERNTFALRKLLHEITNDPIEYISHIRRKNINLGYEDAYIVYSMKKVDPHDEAIYQVDRLNDSYEREQRKAIVIGHFVLLLLILVRLVLYSTIPFQESQAFVIIFSLVFYLLLLFVLENQPRYDVFLALLLSWLAAQSSIYLFENRLPNPFSRDSLKFWLSGLGVLVFLIAVYFILAWVISGSSLTLVDQSGFTATSTPAPSFLQNNFKQLFLGFQGDTLAENTTLSATRSFRLAQNQPHHLRFFLGTAENHQYPYDNASGWKDADFIYSIVVNNQVIQTGNLNDIKGNQYFSFTDKEVPFAQETKIEIKLQNQKAVTEISASRGPLISLEYIDLQ